MRELSTATGVSVPTVKYYLREGLLPPGERAAPNQAHYLEDHVRLLTLIRALIEVGGMPVADVRALLDAVAGQPDARAALESVHNRQGPSGERPDERALAAIEAAAKARGWEIDRNDVAVTRLAEVLTALQKLGHSEMVDRLADYAALADAIAAVDVAAMTEPESTETLNEGVVVGAVLGEELLVALRGIALSQAVNSSPSRARSPE